MSTDWPFTLKRVLEQQSCVLVTLNLILGSAPRESGCRMIVTANAAYGSIGGGNLEYMATHKAQRMLLDSPRPRQWHEPFGLGPALKQCCGGTVTLHFEVLPQGSPGWLDELRLSVQEGVPAVLASAIDRDPPLRILLQAAPDGNPGIPGEVAAACRQLLAPQNGADIAKQPSQAPEQLLAVERKGDTWWLERIRPALHSLVLFGAGHVGQEVARLLERLPFALTWVDSRTGVLPVTPVAHIHTRFTQDPVAEVAHAGPGSIFVVMTHSHELDEDLCYEILRRGDFCWLGLIGSSTKRRRFVQRLNKRGVSHEALRHLVCPIGLVGIHGKQPATIALSLAAQLMMEQPWTRANN
jgi:xanthine dehydrogenase accessory factor